MSSEMQCRRMCRDVPGRLWKRVGPAVAQAGEMIHSRASTRTVAIAVLLLGVAGPAGAHAAQLGPAHGAGCTYSVLAPNGGEFWFTGTARSIQWESIGADCGLTVRLDLYKGGSFYATIDSSTNNDGSRTWNIPSSYPTASDYRVEVSDTANPGYSDTSDADFSLLEVTSDPPTLLLYASRQACVGSSPAVLLGWYMPEGTAPEITVFRDDGQYTAVVDTAVDGPVHVVTGDLQHGQGYGFTVAGVTDGWPSFSNEVRVHIMADTCLLPVGTDDPPHRPLLWADPVYCDSGAPAVRLRWGEVPGATGYRLARSGPFSGGNTQFEGLSGDSFVDDTVVAGGVAFYTLYADSAASANTSWGFATMVPGTICDDPGHPGVFEGSVAEPVCQGENGSATVSWTVAGSAGPDYRTFRFEDHGYDGFSDSEQDFTEDLLVPSGMVGRMFVQAESLVTPGQFREAYPVGVLVPRNFCGAGTEPPEISMRDARFVGETSAQISAGIYPKASPTFVHFEWGTDSTYGQLTPVREIGSGKGSLRQYVGEDLFGLTCDTTYHYRAVAANAIDTTYSEERTFTTDECPGLPPDVTTAELVADVTEAGATVSGTVNPNGASTEAFFDYGLTSAYGGTWAVGNVGGGSSVVPITSRLEPLTCGRTYRFRARATNFYGPGYGLEASFSTQPCCDGEHLVDGLQVASEITIEACETVRIVNSAVESSGSLTLRAGSSIVLGNGLSIAKGASLSVVIDPALLP